MAKNALDIGANTFQFFSRNPRSGKAKKVLPEDLLEFQKIISGHSFGTLLIHAPYILNPCSAKPSIREFALQIMQEDLAFLEKIPGNYYNFHPGCHVGQGMDTGIQFIVDTLNTVLNSNQHTMVLLETMAGKGSEIGGHFEELRQIIDKVHLPEKIGICLDTCHTYDSGYPIHKKLDDVLENFDQILGIDNLKAIHLNDSKNLCASHKDRHECIGKGTLGAPFFKEIIHHPDCKDLPFILETPNDLSGYAEEIRMLRALRETNKNEKS